MPAPTRHRDPYSGLFPVLAVALAVLGWLSIRFGAVTIELPDMARAIDGVVRGGEGLGLTDRIFLELRLPRAIACALVGASLALGGVLMQALFRNPIVEPGLVGTSSGAAFGAALYFVLGATFQLHAGIWTLPLAACVGAALATGAVLTLAPDASAEGDSTTGVLLVGIAINALFLSGVGFLSYIARDPQARSITFWNLGTLSGAGWPAVALLAASLGLGLVLSLRMARPLNTLMMGEEEAGALGVDVRRLKLQIVAVNVMVVAVATSITGVISFVGLIVPHLLRRLRGGDNHYLVIGGAILGAVVLSAADLAARVLLRPAEMPIGIVTSVVGAPLLIVLLRHRREGLR